MMMMMITCYFILTPYRMALLDPALKKVFDQVFGADVDVMSPAQLQEALSHLGENMHAELHVLNGLCKDIAVSSGNYEHKSISRDSRMSFRLKDFESVLLGRLSRDDGVDFELRSAFNFFDQNRKGYITADDVRLTFICLGEDMSEEEAVEFVTINDHSGEKRLYFEDFTSMFS